MHFTYLVYRLLRDHSSLQNQPELGLYSMLTLWRRSLTRCLFAPARLRRRFYVFIKPNHINFTSSLVIRREFGTPPPQVQDGNLLAEEYDALSDATMESLLDSLENLLDDIGIPEYEVDYHSGVLTLSLGKKGTYVINKQPPNKQIWLSSPFSGPKRYDYSPEYKNWIYSRDGVAMGELLEQELSRALSRDVEVGI